VEQCGLAREREHGPTDADTDDEEEEEGPEDVFDAIGGSATAEETKRDGNDSGEEQEGLEMVHARTIVQAFRPRAAS
jgi:hypothetical protein